MTQVAAAVVGACWGLFIIVWIIGALYNARRGPAAQRRSSTTPSVLLGVVIVWVLLRALPVVDWSSLAVGGSWIRILGLVVIVPSTAFTLWARAELGVMWSSVPMAKQGHVLRMDGPYAIVRHPIYTGMLGMLAGTALAAELGIWVVVFAIALLIVRLKIRAEERLMTEAFPGEYEQYRREVPQLIPRPRRIETHRRPG